MPPGWTVTLFQDSGFRGARLNLTSSAASVGSAMNDSTSSIVVRGAGAMGPVIVYKDASFSGAAQALAVSVAR